MNYLLKLAIKNMTFNNYKRKKDKAGKIENEKISSQNNEETLLEALYKSRIENDKSFDNVMEDSYKQE